MQQDVTTSTCGDTNSIDGMFDSLLCTIEMVWKGIEITYDATIYPSTDGNVRNPKGVSTNTG